MIKLLARIFIKEHPESSGQTARSAYGVLCGVAGVFFNLVLFIVKLIAGIISGSLAVTADALNNLSDAGSSAITTFGFRIASAKPDPDHPFGHGRVEYLSGLMVSAVIIAVGAELGISSIRRIAAPEPPEFSWLLVGLLLVSIGVKLYMAAYNKAYSKQLVSPALGAAAADSLNDCIATSAVLLSLLIYRIFAVNIDAYCGLLVAAFIIFSGLKSARETINPLLGAPADPDFCGRVADIALSNDKIIGMHDLIVHDYGPGRRMVTLHAEVPADGDFRELHDAADNLERELKRELGCDAVVHMDPVDKDNQFVSDTRKGVAEAVKQIDRRCTIHDFRLVTGPTHTKVIFDLLVPFDVKGSDDDIKRRAEELVHSLNPTYSCVVTVDKSFVKQD